MSIVYNKDFNEILEKVYSLDNEQSMGLIMDLGFINISLGNMCYDIENYDQALVHYNSAAYYYSELDNKADIAVAIQGISNSHYALEQYSKVLEYNPIILKYYKENDEKSKAADTAYYSAEACLQLDKYDKASDYAIEAHQLYSRVVDDANQAYAYHLLGRIKFCEDKFVEATEYYSKTINIRERLGLADFLAQDYENLGNSFYWIDKNKKAKGAYLKAEYYNKQAYNNDTQKSILLNLAKVCYYLDQEKEAIAYGENAVELYNSEENLHDLIEVYSIIGDSYYNLEKYNRAVEAYTEAEWRCAIYFEDTSDTYKEAQLNVNIHNCWHQLEQYALAIQFLNRAIKTNEENKNIIELAENYYTMAQTQNEGLNDQNSALTYCKKAHKALSDSDQDDPALEGKVWELLGDITPKLLLQSNKEYLRKTKGHGEQYTEALKMKIKEQTMEYYYAAISSYTRADKPDKEDIVLKKIKLVKEELK